MFNLKRSVLISILPLLLLVLPIHATIIGYCSPVGGVGGGATGLSVNEVTMTSAINTSTNQELITTPVSATNCAGIFSGNDGPLPASNIGGHYDGLLNGADQQDGLAEAPLDPNTLFVPGAFITEEDLQDLDGIDQVDAYGIEDDPGWIFLGKDDRNGSGFIHTTPDGINIKNFLDISFDFDDDLSGSWFLDFTDPDGLLAALDGSVFGDSFFDHFALSFKAGNQFAIYDFDFNILNDLSGDAFDLSVPHDFEGKFDLEFTKSGISHVSFWARDPIDSTQIPEPSTLAIFALGLIGLASRRFKK
jgi:hypothetical protein